MTGSFRLRIGIISVVIGGHFGGGDHFDGGNHFGGGTSPLQNTFAFTIVVEGKFITLTHKTGDYT